MSPDPKKRPRQPPLDHPALAQALVVLACALDKRSTGDIDAPSYLDLAVHVVGLQTELDDLAALLVHYARRYEGTTWKEISAAFGISRPTAYKRFGEASPNDVEQ